MPVTYRLRDDLKSLTVCLFSPFSSPEDTFTTSTLWNYITDCRCQIERGETVRRFPFCVSPSPADAQRSIEEMRRELQKQRKENSLEDDQPVNWMTWYFRRRV